MWEIQIAMVQAAPNRTDADCIVIEVPHAAEIPDHVELVVRLVAARPVSGWSNMLALREGETFVVRARPEFLPPDIKVNAPVRLFLELTGPTTPVYVRPAPDAPPR